MDEMQVDVRLTKHLRKCAKKTDMPYVVLESCRNQVVSIPFTHTLSSKPQSDLKKLSSVNSSVGLVAGWIKEDSWVCVECATSLHQFLTGIEIVGYFCYLLAPPEGERELLDLCRQQLEDSFKVQNENALVLFVYKDLAKEVPETVILAKLYSSYYCTLQNVNLLDEDANTASALLFRAKGQIPLIFEGSIDIDLQKENLEMAMERLKTIFLSEVPMFRAENSNTLLRSSSGGNGLMNINCKNFVKNIYESEKKKSKKYMEEKVPINFGILLQTTGQAALQNNVNHSLVIHCQRRHFLCISTYLPLDVVVVAQETEPIADVYQLFISGILSQLDKLTQCLLTYCKDCQFPTPEVYHFYPHEWDFPVTVIYPVESSDQELEKFRRNIHSELLLPLDRPSVRKANRHYFPNETVLSNYLINPHVGLSPSGVSEGAVAVVYGKYAYHHYKQDYMSDDGWGCAYRSLQTLVSWFRFQGYTEEKVPTHKEIQQALVDISDKPSSFVGSKQWIGSQEVGFCLDHLIGITCKMLYVASGAELANKGRELLTHFQTQGTPVMIGGGVLAHTILGVDFNKDTGDVKFLILDPHYTGSEDLTTVQSKGWCGWKDVQFWDSTAFYNLCLPQRPMTI